MVLDEWCEMSGGFGISAHLMMRVRVWRDVHPLVRGSDGFGGLSRRCGFG